MDAVNGSSSGAGTVSSPWRTLLDVQSRSASNEIVYFRSGVYDTAGIPTVNSGVELRVEFDQDRDPIIWLAYPGESPIIDHRYSGSATPRIRMSGNSIYVDGFEVRNVYVMGFQVEHTGQQGSIFRRNNMHHLMVGGESTNSAFIMTVSSYQNRNYGMVVQDNRFSNLAGVGTTLKFYSLNKLLVENNVHHDTSGAANELKADLGQFTVRGDTYYNMSYNAIGGNQANDNYTADTGSYGEICFNNVRDGGSLGALRLNQNGESHQIFVYRNTFQGRIQVQNTDSADGPFNLSNNVIVNSDSGTPSGSHVYHSEVSAPGRIILSNNLVGYPSDNIVDTNGNLTSSYAQYRGTHGPLDRRDDYSRTGRSHRSPCHPIVRDRQPSPFTRALPDASGRGFLFVGHRPCAAGRPPELMAVRSEIPRVLLGQVALSVDDAVARLAREVLEEDDPGWRRDLVVIDVGAIRGPAVAADDYVVRQIEGAICGIGVAHLHASDERVSIYVDLRRHAVLVQIQRQARSRVVEQDLPTGLRLVHVPADACSLNPIERVVSDGELTHVMLKLDPDRRVVVHGVLDEQLSLRVDLDCDGLALDS